MRDRKVQERMRGRKTALYGLLVALALVLSYVEAQIPAFFVVPGMKLGLTNVVVLAALYRLGGRDALILNLVRIVLVAFTFGNLFSMLYSLAGGILSFLAMAAGKKSGKFSIVGVSVLGGVAHNIGQILVAMAVLENRNLAWYLPFLLASGLGAGVLVGVVGGQLVKRLPAWDGAR